MNLLRKPLSHYVFFTGIYFLLVLLLPANRQAMSSYHISGLQYHVFYVAAVLPVIGIWFAAFNGYAKLTRYAKSVQNTAEGANFKQLAKGCGWLAYALPVSAIVSIILTSLANSHPGFYPTATIVGNYINLLLPVVAFSLLGTSARNLTSRANQRLSITQAKSIMILFILLGVVYCYFIFRHFDLTTLSSTNNAYYLPVWLALLTLVIPYIYAWFIGLLAAFEILLFSRKTRGVIYRRALRFLAYGIAAVIASSIAYQYFSSITPRNGSYSLSITLASVYVIQIVSASGYIFIALGAARLRKIEEV